MKALHRIMTPSSGAAAVEMAIALPFLLILMFGAAEVGNYFVNEHSLVKAVRDGSRFAARQSYTNYTTCSGAPGGTVIADTRNVVMKGYYAGGTGITPNIKASDITLAVNCSSTGAGGQALGGIYRPRAAVCGVGATACAQTVTVTASVTYQPILSSFGFTGLSISLNAASQAAIMGI